MERPRALISVWDKTGVVELAASLCTMGWRIVSTGGTASKLREAGIEVTEVSEVTGHPEIFDGRVKTLNPAVHAGILARRDSKEDMSQLTELGYHAIDLVCVNLYPFEETASREPPASIVELIEMIDIGGPTMVRSAAKNHPYVIVATDPTQYEPILLALSDSDGLPDGVNHEMRKSLALDAFRATAAYDNSVSSELEDRFSESEIPEMINVSSGTGSPLRYGENPHQPAAFYPPSGTASGLSAAVQHGGKPLSYNNYLDLDAALRLSRSLSSSIDSSLHTCVAIKHTNPCGASVDDTQSSAWEQALASDPESAYGCVIALNRTVEAHTAEAIGDHFFECMIAPGYEADALDILSGKKNRRMLTLAPMGEYQTEARIRQVEGGWLSQIQGPAPIDWDSSECVTQQKLDEGAIELARFGSLVISEVQSNAIVIVRST
ncbi:MAG: bifunctional phosphoribosylaminoimidazolecarboxamide formyltransferase/IMP cyclohydrolase PurH, partial [Euryarchaeota archaeon]|nr:bifunctional phosphoribosylaminoimidazolecarboxamide formyltransferase/IMP cyclohydrolase PurH [Euryarchaeota archaeon]